MTKDNTVSLPPTSVTSFLLKIAVQEDKLVFLNSFFTEEESVNCLMEDERALFEQMKILSEGIRRGEKQFSFEFFSEKRNRWFMVKANYTDARLEIKYPIFELLITDITYVKHLIRKEGLQKTEWARLTNEVHSGIAKIRLDEEYSIEWANEYFVENIGNKRFLRDCVDAKDLTRLHYLLNVDLTDNTYSKRIKLKNSSGKYRWFDVRTEQLNKEEFKDNTIYCIFSDVTDQVVHEQELETFQKRYKTVLALSSDVVYEYDAKSDTMYYFGRGENMLMRPKKVEAFSNNIYTEFFDGGKLTAESRHVIDRLRQKAEEGQTNIEDVYVVYEYPDGHKEWVRLTGKFIFDENGSLETAIGKITNVTDYKQKEERLLIKARMDSLTNVDNREFAKEEISHYLMYNAAGYLPSLLIVDIDNFKGINDSYGHGQGDNVLITIAKILEEEFRESDIVGRLGGDEFLAFMKNVKSSDIVIEKAKRIVERVKACYEQVSVSIGVSVMNEETTFEALYKTADIALYQAKKKGKNTFVCYNDLNEDVLEASARRMVVKQSKNVFDMVMEGYPHVYEVNLTKDTVRIYHSKTKSYENVQYLTYERGYRHLLNAVPTRQEKQQFEEYFSSEHLIAAIKAGRKRSTHSIRMINVKKELKSYLIEVITKHEDIEQDACCMFLLKEVEEAKRGELHYDVLTGLYSEQKFYNEVEKKLSEAGDKKYAMIAFDVDHFRVYNDLYSEATANEILCYIADVLRTTTVSDKVYSRYGADRFMLFMSYQDRNDIFHVIEEIRSKCLETPQVNAELKLSFGIYQIADVTTPVRLISDWAWLAEETIKGLSMQYYAFYNEEYRNQMIERQIIENEMAVALEQKQFQMYLQPKYNLETDRVIGAEALVRWKHPVKGMIYPDKFIPLFEKNGFIIKLDEYIWEEACKKIKEWLGMGKEIPISVNISRIHTYDTNFVDKLMMLVEKYEIPIHLLQLEFTESMFVENEQALLSLMNQLKEVGFTLLMDDFGSGYSSLNMLKNVPIDIIKLDRAFFQDILVNTRGKVIIESSIRMIHDLNLDVTAEGIEKKEHIDFLNKCNCNTGQGFFYSKPMHVEEFEKLCL